MPAEGGLACAVAMTTEALFNGDVGRRTPLRCFLSSLIVAATGSTGQSAASFVKLTLSPSSSSSSSGGGAARDEKSSLDCSMLWRMAHVATQAAAAFGSSSSRLKDLSIPQFIRLATVRCTVLAMIRR